MADEAVRVDRLTARMPAGPSRDWHVRRTVELEEMLERAALEDFVVTNDGREPRAVALEVIDRAGWR